MRSALAVGLMLALSMIVGCQRNKTAVRPVPMPQSSTGGANHYRPQNQPVVVEQVGISTGPVSPSPMTRNNGYVASAESPYIELPAVSVPNQASANEIIEQPVEGLVYDPPGAPLANIAPSTYTFSDTDNATPIPTYQPAVALESTVSSGNSVHVVSKGETLWRIAKKYYGSGKRWADIANANGLSDPNRIYVGMKLNIPR
ncbi:MAG: LysM peptidoglycan-binding domain-containing protein [Phycisphaeraceae bacterium]|nr:LysM peptidoglycan-binding domain-containing protein [Phycisphaeraceae bacterium]